ncbi:MAG: biotin/lipoyl-binding protein [Acidimicrobiia bacterium]
MRKRLFLNGILALVVLAAAVGTYFTVRSTKSSASTTQIYATATRANVLSSVTSTGNVEAPTDLSLSFQQSGQVTSILVSVGQHVVANQALATVDDTADAMALSSAQAGLTSAQASLAGLIQGETPIERQQDAMGVVAASQGITQAQQGVTDAQQSAAADSAKFQASVTQAQQAVTAAQSNLTSAQNAVQQAESALSTLQATADPGHPIGASTDALTTRYEIVQAHCPTPATPGSTYDGVECAQVSNLLNFVKGVQSAQSSVTQAQSAVTQAQAGLTSATQAQSSGEMQDQQSIQKAQDQLTTAQTQYQTTLVGNAVKQSPPLPAQLAQSQASIVSAQAQLQTAQKNLSETTLRAPVAGVVAAVNGLVGQQSGSGGGGSSSSSSSGGSSASSGASSSSASSSSSSAFIELTDVNLLEVKVGFTETDAPNVHVGQAATITLDALPNQTFTGHVIELDTDSTLVSNVVTYYALISFDTTPTGVKPGMTASVNVVLQNVNDAITLPTSAVSTTGTTETVTVKAKDGTVSSKLITIGLRGDNAVQIISGLNVGDQVVETSTASTGSSSILGRFGGGGLGGGGLGGGGLGGGGGGGRGGG